MAFSFPPPTSLENTSIFSGWKLWEQDCGECWHVLPHFKDLVHRKTAKEIPPWIPAVFFLSSWIPIEKSLGSQNLATFGEQRVFFKKTMGLGKRMFSSYFFKGFGGSPAVKFISICHWDLGCFSMCWLKPGGLAPNRSLLCRNFRYVYPPAPNRSLSSLALFQAPARLSSLLAGLDCYQQNADTSDRSKPQFFWIPSRWCFWGVVYTSVCTVTTIDDFIGTEMFLHQVN